MKSIQPFIFLVMLLGISSQTVAQSKSFTIENFDGGHVQLESYPNEDEQPTSWELSTETTFNSSPYALKLYGNTWKVQEILASSIDSGDVWQVSAYIQSVSEIQGFGITDGTNTLFYSFAGTEELSMDTWVPVYQGCFPEGQWNNYQLPIADDWLALYGYLPEINAVVYVNDNDASSSGTVFFDEIIDISEDLPTSPQVTIDYSSGSVYNKGGKKLIDILFSSEVIDPDSETHTYHWNFGDGSVSSQEAPAHSYVVEDDHQYTVLLKVEDPTSRWGQASCEVEVDQGVSTFPITLNFVGDVMLARNYENPGGIIQTQGVEAIFEPIKPYLGDATDITIANLECPLTTHWQEHPTKSICFKGSPENVDGLTYAGIDIVTLANNHILDYLEPGMAETQSVLRDNNILYSGAGMGSYEAYLPVFYSKYGVNFAFLAASDRTGQYNNYQPYLNAGYNKSGFANLDKYYLEKQINEVAEISDLVVLEWHCGYEYSTVPHKDEKKYDVNEFGDEDYSPLSLSPSKSNRSIRQYAIDKGADLVICHHPHITHGVELYKGKLIAHSLGNFAFDLKYPETFPSMILNTEVDERGFYAFSITPVYIDHYIPRRAEGKLGLHILDDLAKRSKDLDTYVKVDRENITAQVIMDTLNMLEEESKQEALLNLNQTGGQWITQPYPLKKSGSITSVDQIMPSGDYKFRLGCEKIWFGNMEDEGCRLWEMNNANESYCDTVAFSGERSIQHIRDNLSPYNLITNFEKKIICRSDTSKYTLSGYIKTKNGKDVTVEVQYFDNRNSSYPIGQENIGVFVDGDTPWMLYHKELTIPAGTKFFDIRLNSNIPNEGTAYAWFDDISLIQWNNWDEFAVGENIPAPNDFYFMQFKSQQNNGVISVEYTETGFYESPVEISEFSNKESLNKQLGQNIPNPFNPNQGATTIHFSIQEASKVKISIYNIHGSLIKTLTERSYKSGSHSVHWDGKNTHGEQVSSGLYLYQLELGSSKFTQKCLVVYH